MRALTVCVLLFLALFGGCKTVPKTEGGKAKTSLGDTTQGSLSQSDNPETPSVQNISRKERTVTHYPAAPAPWGEGNWQKAPPPAQASAPGVIVEHTVEQHSSTEIGSAQNIANILKAAQANGRALASVLLGLCLLVGAYRAFKATWPILGSVLAAGGVLSIIFLNYWVAIGGIGAALLLYIAYKLAEKAAPLP